MKKRALILLSLASLLPAAAPAEDEVRFGRLFMEPNTRQQLDESRKQNSSAHNLPVTEEIEETAVTALKVDGVVMRRDGSTEVWVNGVRSDSQLTVRRIGGNRFQVSVPGGGEITLKPGQIYSFETRHVIEGYEAAKELAAPSEAEQTRAAPQNPAQEQASVIVKTGPATAQAPETKTVNPSPAGQPAEFNESELADEDFRIQLLEERMEKLEQGDGAARK